MQNPTTVTGATKEAFDRVAAHYGMVPTLQQALGPLPEVTSALWDLSTATMRDGSLSEEMKRAIFVVTAAVGECDYCVAAHMLALFRHGWSAEDCAEIATGNPSSRLDASSNALLAFARTVAERPAAVTDAMVNELRNLGWKNAEVVEAVTTPALLKYTSTVATALDVPLETVMLPLLDGPPFR